MVRSVFAARVILLAVLSPCLVATEAPTHRDVTFSVIASTDTAAATAKHQDAHSEAEARSGLRFRQTSAVDVWHTALNAHDADAALDVFADGRMASLTLSLTPAAARRLHAASGEVASTLAE